MPQGDGPNYRIYRTATVSSGRMTGSGVALVDGGNVQSVNRSEQRRANVKADFSYFGSSTARTRRRPASARSGPSTPSSIPR